MRFLHAAAKSLNCVPAISRCDVFNLLMVSPTNGDSHIKAFDFSFIIRADAASKLYAFRKHILAPNEK